MEARRPELLDALIKLYARGTDDGGRQSAAATPGASTS